MAACYECGDCACQVRPGKALKDLVQSFEKGSGCPTDPGFRADFDVASQIYFGNVEPNFSSAANVYIQSGYGIKVVQPYGLLPDVEYPALLGGTPSDLPKQDQTVQ